MFLVLMLLILCLWLFLLLLLLFFVVGVVVFVFVFDIVVVVADFVRRLQRSAFPPFVDVIAFNLDVFVLVRDSFFKLICQS